MKDFMVMLRGSFEEWNKNSPEEMQEIIKKYVKWSEELKAEGRLKGGHGLDSESILIKKEGENFLTIDGPYVETKEALTGYFIISAKDLNEITEIVKAGCPVLTHGETAEIIPIGH